MFCLKVETEQNEMSRQGKGGQDKEESMEEEDSNTVGGFSVLGTSDLETTKPVSIFGSRILVLSVTPCGRITTTGTEIKASHFSSQSH